jgi:pyruvate formate lyase activating enzyme
MLIGGVEKLSLLDYPDRLSAIVFTQGCNFRCHFCYNPMLVLPNVGGAENKLKDRLISEDDLLAFLQKRIGKLDAVVITGGEPTINSDLPEFITKIKNLGYLIKLDTNGTNPDMLNYLINKKLLNYIAMDIKAPLAKYEEVVNVRVDLNKIQESVKIIKGVKLPYEFRTTVAPNFLKLIDVGIMAKELVGAKKWYLQKFESNKSLVDSKLENTITYTDQELESMAQLGRAIMKNCYYRTYA